MLQKLNDRIQGLISWVIVAVVTLTFTLFGLDYYLQSRHGSDVKVQVNGKAITQQAFDLNFRRISQTQDPTSVTPETEQTLKQQVLSEMILNMVSVESAHKHGFDVDTNQVYSAILRIPQFQEDGHFSTSRYTQALSNAFYTPQTFQQELKQGMLLNQQRFALIGTSFVLPNELNQFVRLAMQTRDYQYARIKATDFTSKVAISKNDILHYYNHHKTDFQSQEQVSIDYIHLSLQDIRKNIAVSPEVMLRYYEDNMANYVTPAKWHLAYMQFPLPQKPSEDAVARIKKQATAVYDTLVTDPTRFDEISKQELIAHHAEQGVSSVVTAGKSKLALNLMDLTSPGQISAPILTKSGYKIFKVTAYEPSTTQPFLEVKTLIEEQLTQEEVQKQYADAVDVLSELSYQNPDSLAPAAEALHVTVLSSGLFTRDGDENNKLLQHPVVRQAAFSHDVLVFGNNSDPIQLDTDNVVVLRVKQHIPSTLQPLVAVQPTISSILLKKKSAQAAQEFGKNIANQSTTSGLSSLPWRSAHGASRDTDTLNTRINELAFGLSKVGDYNGATLKNGDYVLVRLSSIHPGKIESLDQEQIANITQQIEANYGLMDYDLYVNQLMDVAKIEKH